jgi:thymidylate synthase
MIPYLALLRQCREQGVRQKNRTGIDTFMIPGGMMKFDFSIGFPILTTKRIAFKQVVGELLGFIRGYDSAEKFRSLGCTIWDANANVNKAWLENPLRKGDDDLGRIYGVQWRDWEDGNGRHYDQLGKALDMIKKDPQSRRNVVSAWNPAQMNQMALPPCHYAFQFLVEQERRLLHLCMTMRSCDMFLGVPFNITSYALLLALAAKATGYDPGQLTMFLADVHIYANHLDQVDEQLARGPRFRPELLVTNLKHPDWRSVEWLSRIEPDEISLKNYDPHPPIKAEMAV